VKSETEWTDIFNSELYQESLPNTSPPSHSTQDELSPEGAPQGITLDLRTAAQVSREQHIVEREFNTSPHFASISTASGSMTFKVDMRPLDQTQLSRKLRSFIDSDKEPATKMRYASALSKFYRRYTVLNRLNILEHGSTLGSLGSLDAFLSAAVWISKESLYKDREIKALRIAMAKKYTSARFGEVINILDFAQYIDTNVVDLYDKLCLKLFILLAARPSDIARIREKDVRYEHDGYVLVNRIGVKQDRLRKGLPLKIPPCAKLPILRLRPDSRQLLFPDSYRCVSEHLRRCFNREVKPKFIRSSVVSLLSLRGCPMSRILRIGGWSNERVVHNHYENTLTDVIDGQFKLRPINDYNRRQEDWPLLVLKP
jgi:integrase